MERASVAPVWVAWPWCFPCGTSFGRARCFRPRCGTPGHKVRKSAAGLVRTVLCRPEGDFRQTRPLTRVEASIRLSVGDRNRLQQRALNLGAANQGVDHRVPHSKCIRRRKIRNNSAAPPTQAKANAGERNRQWAKMSRGFFYLPKIASSSGLVICSAFALTNVSR